MGPDIHGDSICAQLAEVGTGVCSVHPPWQFMVCFGFVGKGPGPSSAFQTLQRDRGVEEITAPNPEQNLSPLHGGVGVGGTHPVRLCPRTTAKLKVL